MEFLLLIFEELSTLLLLIGLSQKGLRSKFHLSSNTGYLFPEFQVSSRKLYFIVLNFCFIFDEFHLEFLSELVIFLEKLMNAGSIGTFFLLQLLNFGKK